MNNLISKPKILSILVIILITIYAFQGIQNIFFQQDEWLGLGGVIYRQETFGGVGGILQIFNFKNVNESTRFLPVTSIANSLIYSNFGTNSIKYGILSLIIIIACALILNTLIYKLTNSLLISTITSVMWVTNNLAYQAFTWIATLMPSLLTVFFFLLGLYFLLVFNEKKKKYLLIVSILFVILSLFSKESSIFYLITYLIVVWFFFKEKFSKSEKIKLTGLLFIPILISLFFPRLLFSLNKQNNLSPSVDSANGAEITYNLFLIPARSLFHVYFPQKQIYELIYMANNVHYSAQTNGFVVESIIADTLSLLVAFYFLLIIFIIILVAKNNHRKIILFALASFFASTLPFVIFKNDTAILETRFYIFPAIWASLLLSSALFALFSRIPKIRNILMFLVFIPIIYYNTLGIHKLLAQDILTGQYRKNILTTILEVKPQLGKNNIFYVFTDNNGFYEFQSGFGQTLAVLFYSTGKIPKEVLIDRDYWDLSFEGLKTYDKGKFGYYMTYDKLLTSLKDNKDINLNSIHSFYWNQANHTVKDVSNDIRKKLAKDLNETF